MTPTENLQQEIFASDNEVATKVAAPNLLRSSKRLAYCRLNLVAAVGLEPTTYGL
jgi:hypothetical protein